MKRSASISSILSCAVGLRESVIKFEERVCQLENEVKCFKEKKKKKDCLSFLWKEKRQSFFKLVYFGSLLNDVGQVSNGMK